MTEGLNGTELKGNYFNRGKNIKKKKGMTEDEMAGWHH